jgi:hypothetical protein
MAVFDWGDGRTYSDLPSALAGGASFGLTLAEDYEFPGYLNTGSSTDYAQTGNLNIPAFNTSGGVYSVHIYGTVGSIVDKDLIKIVFSSSTDGLVTTSMTDYGLIVEDLIFDNTAGTSKCVYVRNTQYPVFRRCIALGPAYGFYIYTNVPKVINCYAEGNVAVAVVNGNGAKLSRSVFKGRLYEGLSCNRNFLDVDTCLFYGLTYGASVWSPFRTVNNSVFVGGTHAISGALTTYHTGSGYVDNVMFFSEANPTEVSPAGDMSATFGVGESWQGLLLLDDPEYGKTGTYQDWFIPESTSPLRVENQSFLPNVLFGTNRDKISQGAWSDATEVAANDIIKSAGGNYNDDNLIDSNVKLDVLYGIGGVGSYDPAGTEPIAPTVTRVVVGDGSITISYIANSETDVIYARYRRNKPSLDWADRSESFKRTGSGDITVTGLSNGQQYEVCGQNVSDVLYSDFSNSYFAVPDSDAFATSRNNSKIQRRDRIALTALQVAQRTGVKVDFENVQGEGGVNLYAVVSESSEKILDVKSGNIEYTTTVLQIARQTNFPPLEFYPNSLVTINEKVYQVESVKGDNEDDNMASTWEVRCNVSGECYGY